MKRRTFIAGLTSTGLISIAGCSTTSETPPPRRSDIIETVEIENGELVIEQYEDDEQWVASRRELSDVDTNATLSVVSSLSPVGVAEAKGRGGRGATSRGAGGRSFSSAPKTRSGRGFYGGGPYVGTWYNDHDDDVERYPVEVKNIGIAYIGTNEEFSELNPGPGEINNWDESLTDPDGEISVAVNDLETGWYRVGADVALDADGSGVDEVDFGWEAIDIRIEETGTGKEITEEWKVSPRI